MVLTILIPACAIYRPLGELMTASHVDKMCKVLLLTGSLVGYSYAMELFTAWYGGNPYDRAAFWQRGFGPYGWACAAMVVCNVVVPQLFWFRVFRSHLVHSLSMGDFSSDLGGRLQVRRDVRAFCNAVSAFHPLPANDRHV